MQFVWESIVIIGVALSVFCVIGFAMNDILSDIRERKKTRKARENSNNEILKHKTRKTQRNKERYLRTEK